jgi:Protein of unknown function (DUF2845)
MAQVLQWMPRILTNLGRTYRQSEGNGANLSLTSVQGAFHGQDVRRKDAEGIRQPAIALQRAAHMPGPPCLLVRRFGSFRFILGSGARSHPCHMPSRLIAVAAALSCLVSPAYAFRCGSHIVSEGDTRVQVLARCGEPADVSRSEIERRIWLGGPRGHHGYGSGHDFVLLPVEYWIYNLGPNRLMQRVRFIDGVVVEVESLGYGYN